MTGCGAVAGRPAIPAHQAHSGKCTGGRGRGMCQRLGIGRRRMPWSSARIVGMARGTKDLSASSYAVPVHLASILIAVGDRCARAGTIWQFRFAMRRLCHARLGAARQERDRRKQTPAVDTPRVGFRRREMAAIAITPRHRSWDRRRFQFVGLTCFEISHGLLRSRREIQIAFSNPAIPSICSGQSLEATGRLFRWVSCRIPI
jgi:hypothetical protein